jgi:DNA-binding beta-propeller fold protein YncE
VRPLQYFIIISAIFLLLFSACDAILPLNYMSGRITTVAGHGAPGYWGDDGPATAALFNNPAGIAIDPVGNLYIADCGNHCIREVDLNGIIKTIAGTGDRGYNGDTYPATWARLNEPTDVAIDSTGQIYIADRNNHAIRKIQTNGIIVTVAGNGSPGYSGDGGEAIDAMLNYPTDLSVDKEGNLYIADCLNSCIRRIDVDGHIETIAGNGTAGYAGDGEPAAAAILNYAGGVTVDSAGELYITDSGNHRLRKVNTAGIITTLAGNGDMGYSGDGGQAIYAILSYPYSITVDSADCIYFCDMNNDLIRKVNNLGFITTVAGNGIVGTAGDNGLATAAELGWPMGLAVDPAGNLYIADTYFQRIRKVWR